MDPSGTVPSIHPCPPDSPAINHDPADNELSRVLAGGYCVGCGGCASLEEAPTRMRLTGNGMLEAQWRQGPISPRGLSNAEAVCPFSNAALNEDQLGQALFDDPGVKRHEAIGQYLACYAGHVEESDYRERGSSGGLGSWLQCELLETGMADYLINVAPSPGGDGQGLLFRYTICSTAEEVRQSAKSRYYPIEMSEVMRRVRETPGRYAFVGLPCYVKAARLLCRKDPVLNERLKWFIGLVCGHLKSKRFAEYFAWQLGVQPGELRQFDFRKKLADRSADDYGVEALGATHDGETSRIEAVRSLDGGDWGRGYFKYKACDFCDDVLAETADVVVGDAWLPAYSKEWQGTNVVVVRNPAIQVMLEEARRTGRLSLDELSPEAVARSQDAGLRHRRGGLRYRLHLRAKGGEWAPQKRVSASAKHLSRWERKRHRLREAMRDLSHQAFADALKQNELNHFLRAMKPLVEDYEKMSAPKSSTGPRAWGDRALALARRIARMCKATLRGGGAP